MQPKKWHEVYPRGTKEGEEEAKLFKALSRHPKYQHRSTSALQKETGLSERRIEEIIDKYINNFTPSLIYPHPTNEDHWCYWERVPSRVKKEKRNISKKEQDHRVKKHLGCTNNCGGNDGCDHCDD